jgi:NarL family two-component system response regulator LiaR
MGPARGDNGSASGILDAYGAVPTGVTPWARSDEMAPIRLALSNDYHVVLVGLAAMLADHADRVEVVVQSSERDLSDAVDVILYDTFGRLADGDDKLREMVAANAAKVVVYSWDNYPVETAREHGAAGYIHKGLPPSELVDAIVAIHEGTSTESEPAPPGLAEEQTMRTWPGQTAGLSPRESEILSFIALGFTNEEIAARAYLSINTVKTYIRTAYRKIGVTSRAQAVGWALRNGFESEV